MSERLYYHDAYAIRFKAEIVERVTQNGRFALVLNRSYFYPTSGGQPADRGAINGTEVIDVTIRQEDNAVLHWLRNDRGDWDQSQVTAVIDWPRRFDHMQQHTGQHILSQAFINTVQAQTVGFHLSEDSVTIDLNVHLLTLEQLRQTEQLANQIVWENRPVHIQMVSLEQARQMSLRKLPATPGEQIRLIDIENFDVVACGGTHVSRTGAVGIIKIIKVEKVRNQTRVEFRCGRRALSDYVQKNETIQQLMAQLTTGHSELVTAVSRLKGDNKEARRAIKKLRADLLRFKAKQLLASGQQHGGITVITHIFEETDSVDLRLLGNQLTQNRGVVAMLVKTNSGTQFMFCRSEDAPGEMNALLKGVIQEVGTGNGGGSALSAQGGAPAIDYGRLRQALDWARGQIIELHDI